MTRRDEARPAPLGDGAQLVQRLRELRQASGAMRRVRWLGVLFIAVQFTLYKPPQGLDLPWPRFPVAAAVLGAVIAVNLLSLWSRRVSSVTALARIGAGELVADAAVIMTVTWLFSFDVTSALWALLVIPVLEGAVRGQLRGALWTWGVLSLGYLARDLWAAETYDYAPFMPESVTYRMFIVLIVAVTAGQLARDLTRAASHLAVQVRAHRDAQRESERRSDLLQTVAAAGRHMTSLDLDQLLAIVVDSVQEVGFDSAAICVLDEQGGGFSVPHLSGLRYCDPEELHPSDRGIVGLALARGETLTVAEPVEWFGGSEPLGFARTMATPVWSGEDLSAVLVGGMRAKAEIPAHVQECFELLGAQAGAAMVNAKRYRDRRLFQEQLEYQAFHDALTGLPNRAMFLDRLNQALGAPAPGEPAGMVALLFCDLDRFKAINDTLGHDFGDKLLTGVAARLSGCVRSEDLVARLGGDEFTVLLGPIANEAEAEEIARRVIQAMARPLLLDGREVYVTTSVGLAYGTRGSHDAQDLLRAADLAMYQAKDEGRDRYAVSAAVGAPDEVRRLRAHEVVL